MDSEQTREAIDHNDDVALAVVESGTGGIESTSGPDPRNEAVAATVANNGLRGRRPGEPECVASSEHLGKHRQYWRDMILGVNDGMVSTFLLVAGVVGGGLTSRDILLTSIAGALAGAVSMASGEFVATKSQNEVLRGEIELERTHVRNYEVDELKELEGLLGLIGIPSDQDDHLRQELLQFYSGNPDALLKVMVALEFGVIEEEQRSAALASWASGLLFTLGALPSVVPFAFDVNPTTGLIAAAVATTIALLVVGAIKTWATRGNWIPAAAENLCIAAFGGGLAYGVGLLFDDLIR